MKVALVHDDLVQWGGAEKVLLEVSNIFPDAPIYTSVFDQANLLIADKFKNKKIITSFMQKIPGWRSLYRPLLPLYPLAFEQFDFSEFDLVISQTTKFAKAIITKPETIHICLIHTPPRFLWHLPADRYSWLLEPLFSWMRFYDQLTSQRVDHFIAGSFNCQQRVSKIYQKDSIVLQPFVDEKIAEGMTSFDGGYYLLIARLNSYKNVKLVVETFNKNGKNLKIVGRGPEGNKLKKLAKNNITFYEGVTDQLIRSFLAGCSGLIVSAEEDFGMTALEAQIFGKGVIAYGYGGSLETVINGKTGTYFKELTVKSLQLAVEEFEKNPVNPVECIKNVQKFTLAKFNINLKNILNKITQ